MATKEERTSVIILTGHYRINGEISLLPSARVTDYILGSDPFIVVTDAEVVDHSGNVILTSAFMNVNRDRIEAIMPVDLAVKLR